VTQALRIPKQRGRALSVLAILSLLTVSVAVPAQGNGAPAPATTMTLSSSSGTPSFGSEVTISFKQGETPVGNFFDIWVCGEDDYLADNRPADPTPFNSDTVSRFDCEYLTFWDRAAVVGYAADPSITALSMKWTIGPEDSPALDPSSNPYIGTTISEGVTRQLPVQGIDCSGYQGLEAPLYIIVNDWDGGGHSNWLGPFDCPISPSGSGGVSPSTASSMLLEDTSGLDNDWSDSDIMRLSYASVISSRPDSRLALLADSSVSMTLFIPSDRAFRALVFDLTGVLPSDEKATFRAVRGLGISRLESILLHHVYFGDPIDSTKASGSKGVKLTSALGKTVTIAVSKDGKIALIRDGNPNLRNARVIAAKADINKGARHIGHYVNRVVVPLKSAELAR